MKLVKVELANTVIKQKLPLSTCWPTHSLVRTYIWSEFKRETSSPKCWETTRFLNSLNRWGAMQFLVWTSLGHHRQRGSARDAKLSHCQELLRKFLSEEPVSLLMSSYSGPDPPPPPHHGSIGSFLNYPTSIPNHTLLSWYPPQMTPVGEKYPGSEIPNAVRCNDGSQGSEYRDWKSSVQTCPKIQPQLWNYLKIRCEGPVFPRLTWKEPTHPIDLSCERQR